MLVVRTNVGIQAEVIQNPRMYYPWANNTLSLPPFVFQCINDIYFILLSSQLRKQIRQENFNNIFLIIYWRGCFFLFYRVIR